MTKASSPISSHRRGRLKIPVPIAEAINAKIIPRMEPCPIGEKALFMKERLIGGDGESISYEEGCWICYYSG